MGREILTDVGDRRIASSGGFALEGIQPGTGADDYSSRLLKYIPAEVIAVYLAVEGILLTAEPIPVGLFWGVFVLLLILTPLYLWRVQEVTKKTQLLLFSISFAVWVFTIGGPFTVLSWYQPVYGAVLLPIFTFSVAIYQP